MELVYALAFDIHLWSRKCRGGLGGFTYVASLDFHMGYFCFLCMRRDTLIVREATNRAY